MLWLEDLLVNLVESAKAEEHEGKADTSVGLTVNAIQERFEQALGGDEAAKVPGEPYKDTRKLSGRNELRYEARRRWRL